MQHFLMDGLQHNTQALNFPAVSEKRRSTILFEVTILSDFVGKYVNVRVLGSGLLIAFMGTQCSADHGVFSRANACAC